MRDMFECMLQAGIAMEEFGCRAEEGADRTERAELHASALALFNSAVED